jgi:hypothetical protein
VRRPIERAEKGARGDRRVGRAERFAPDAVRHERAHATLVAIALGDREATQAGRQRVHLEVRRRSFDLVQQAEHMGHGQLAQPVGERPAALARARERQQEPIERSILAEEEDLVLAAEVVIEVARRQVGGHGNFAHAGGGEAARAEDVAGRAHDAQPPAIGAL